MKNDFCSNDFLKSPNKKTKPHIMGAKNHSIISYICFLVYIISVPDTGSLDFSQRRELSSCHMIAIGKSYQESLADSEDRTNICFIYVWVGVYI